MLGLILTFYISFALSAKKTALILNQVFGVNVSYQTVLNYAQAAASYCHKFNLKHKGSIDDLSAGDETYIKIKGKHHYVWLFISTEKKTITAYHLSNNRETLPAVAAMNEAVRTASPDQNITLVTDGNPSYADGIHFLNQTRSNKISHSKVIGLQNLDPESEEYRSFKQMIERLNRTFKHHVRPAVGFNHWHGAMTVTTLFVTHYNFLRPHMTLNYNTPIHMPILDQFNTIQQKWISILTQAA